MKKTVTTLSLLIAILPVTIAAAESNNAAPSINIQDSIKQVDTPIQAETDKPAEEVKALRKKPIDGPEDPPVDGDWKPTDGRVPRTFIHQPPVIPHNINGFIISSMENYCLGCHGVEGLGAPRPFETHYMDRDGNVTKKIAARWNNCTQCHVGQADAPPLVENVFGSGKGKYSLGTKE
jgi:cytochrome c-type protein NapB